MRSINFDPKRNFLSSDVTFIQLSFIQVKSVADIKNVVFKRGLAWRAAEVTKKNHSPLKNCDVLQVAEKDWMDLYNVGTIKQIHRAALKFDITYNPFLNSVYCSLFNNISNYIKT